MKIETLVNLIGGELLNSPYISEVTSYTDNVDNVVRGSCFFAFNEEDIKTAVKKGSYAIISDVYQEIIDKEIAWIKVSDFRKAVFDIFKYEKLKEKIYFCDFITSEIIEKMSLDKNLKVLKNIEDLIASMNIPDVIMVTAREDFKELVLNTEFLTADNIELFQLTLFKSRFKNAELNLPYVYKEEFSKALKFFEKNELKYSLEFELERFKPVFVDRFFHEVEYGQSDRALIKGIKNDEYFFKELNYIIENTKHAKTVIVNENMKNLLNEPFNFAVLVDFDMELNKENFQKELF